MDLIIGISLLSFVLLATMRVSDDLQIKLDRRDVQVRALALANSSMSLIRAVDFDNNSAPPWTLANNLGTEAAHVVDDIDDYIGSVEVPSFGNFGATDDGFSYNVQVFYIDPTITPPNMTVPLTGNVYTNYKRVIVNISHPLLNNPVTLSSIILLRSSV